MDEICARSARRLAESGARVSEPRAAALRADGGAERVESGAWTKLRELVEEVRRAGGHVGVMYGIGDAAGTASSTESGCAAAEAVLQELERSLDAVCELVASWISHPLSSKCLRKQLRSDTQALARAATGIATAVPRAELSKAGQQRLREAIGALWSQCDVLKNNRGLNRDAIAAELKQSLTYLRDTLREIDEVQQSSNEALCTVALGTHRIVQSCVDSAKAVFSDALRYDRDSLEKDIGVVRSWNALIEQLLAVQHDAEALACTLFEAVESGILDAEFVDSSREAVSEVSNSMGQLHTVHWAAVLKCAGLSLAECDMSSLKFEEAVEHYRMSLSRISS